MRVGRWTKEIDYGEGSPREAGFPSMPSWFKDNRHFGAITVGLEKHGFSKKETSAIMGENWLRFYDKNFNPQKF
jgi:microsomal dipeptidase-like Zn-dependent dipeptidase